MNSVRKNRVLRFLDEDGQVVFTFYDDYTYTYTSTRRLPVSVGNLGSAKWEIKEDSIYIYHSVDSETIINLTCPDDLRKYKEFIDAVKEADRKIRINKEIEKILLKDTTSNTESK